MKTWNKKAYYLYVLLVVAITFFVTVELISKPHLTSEIFGMFIPTPSHKRTIGDAANTEGFEKTSQYEPKGKIYFNSLGFKDDEWKEERENITQIVALGDSMTQGAFVANNATWPEQLEEKLKKKHKDNFEVMNFAAAKEFDPGVYDHWQIFKNISLQFDPDMVILQYYGNDWRSPEFRGKIREKWRENKEKIIDNIKEVTGREDLSKSAASRTFYEIQLKKYYNQTNRKEEWDKWVKPYLTKIINTTKGKSIPLIVITWDSVEWQREKLTSVLEKYNISFYDFSNQLPKRRPSKYRLPDGHLTPYGYGIVANETYSIINSRGYFK